MTELLAPRPEDRVLDVGTGSGYHAAVLAAPRARTCGRSSATRACRAARRDNLAAAGVHNVTLVVGDGTRGLPESAPFDAINVAAAGSSEALAELEDQLALGGRLDRAGHRAAAAPVAHAPHATPASSASCSRRCASYRSCATTDSGLRHRRRVLPAPPRGLDGGLLVLAQARRRTRARGRRAAPGSARRSRPGAPRARCGSRRRACAGGPRRESYAPGRRWTSVSTGAKRSPCSSTRRRTSARLEGEVLGLLAPRGPRPRSPASTRSGAASRAASRR